MKIIGLAITVAILTEGLVSYGESIYDYIENGDTKKAIKQVCAIFLGVGFAFAVHLTLISFLAEVPVNPVFDMVFSGIVISRGSNYLFDLFKKIRNKPVEGLEDLDEYEEGDEDE